jgi:hypothetical protein
MDLEIILLDNRPWPNAGHELVLAHGLTPRLGENAQDFECPTTQLHGLAIA